jgi:hypothetical protein
VRGGDRGVAVALGPHALAHLPGEHLERLRCDAPPDARHRILGALRVSAGLTADRLELDNAVPQHRVGEIGDAILDRVVKPLKFGVCFGRPLAQCGDMPCPGARRAPARGRALRTGSARAQDDDEQTVLAGGNVGCCG